MDTLTLSVVHDDCYAIRHSSRVVVEGSRAEVQDALETILEHGKVAYKRIAVESSRKAGGVYIWSPDRVPHKRIYVPFESAKEFANQTLKLFNK